MKKILVYLMIKTGFRFTKDYRHGKTLFHKIVYKLLPVIHLNLKAGLRS